MAVKVRWIRQSAIAIAAVTVTLALVGVIDYWSGFGIGAALEMTLAGVVLGAAIKESTAARRGHQFGRVEHALPALRLIVPGPVAKAIAVEWSIVTSVPLWILRRRAHDTATRISYNGQFRWMMTIAVALGALEALVLYIVLTNTTFHIVHNIIAGYGIIWIVGFASGASLYSHILSSETFVARFSVFQSVTVPLMSGTSVSSSENPHHKKTMEIEDGAASLSVLGRTNVVLHFETPVELTLGKLGTQKVHSFAFYADEPRPACELIGSRLAVSEAGPKSDDDRSEGQVH